MNEQDIKTLIRLLKNYATTPCEFECHECNGCEIGDYCLLLYYVSQGITKQITHSEMMDKINADYNNVKGFD